MSLIKSLQINWLSPEQIKKLSFGKITNHKTINSRTLKPELGGIFDPVIFGPSLNYECWCGKYSGWQNRGQNCEVCGTLITEKIIERWRAGHISLPTPVTNIIIFKFLAANLSWLLKIPVKKLEDIIYFRSYIVIDNGLSSLLKKKEILFRKIDLSLLENIFQEIIACPDLSKKIIQQAQELRESLQKDRKENKMVYLEDYLNFLEKNWQVKIWTGTEAFRELLREINLEKELEEIKSTHGENEKSTNEKIRFLQSLIKNGIKLEWIVMDNLLIIPRGLRPVTKLKEKDTIANTQINNLLKKIILTGERLNYHLDLSKIFRFFPIEVIHNEKKRFQKVIDQYLYEPAQKRQVVNKGLVQILSGKEGILRRYSLGKRVNYSARSVIVPNPTLRLDQIGLPVKMALVLYQPLIIQRIIKEGITFTVEEAEQLIKEGNPVVFSLLSEVVKNHPVLANRAPSLHRLSIQGFYPQLTRGKSIELHPFVTGAFNADFDGDQIAIHLPLTKKSCQEIIERVLAPQHIIDPKNGHLITAPTQDTILGIYCLTKEKKGSKLIYYDEINDIWRDYETGRLNINELLVIPAHLVGRNLATASNQFLFTTLGKLIFNQTLPPSFPFYLSQLHLNEEEHQYREILAEVSNLKEKWTSYLPLSGWKKKDIITFLNNLVNSTPRSEMVDFLDKLKKVAFDFVTYSGISVSPFELGETVPQKKKQLVKNIQITEQIEEHYEQGFYGEEEKKQKKFAIWEQWKNDLQTQLVSNLEKKKDSSFYHVWSSGARTSSENLTQIFAMRGHVTDYTGEIIETPIVSSLWEGLSPFEFFISTYGAIKGMIDVSLKTAEAGYLTRRLVEASQNISIVSSDCQTKSGLLLTASDTSLLIPKVYGRYLAQDITDEQRKVILIRNTLLLEKEVKILRHHKITSAWVFSPLKCELGENLCQKCYGVDLSRPGEVIAHGEAVGIIAAQSLGEPGTQLTMRTFKTGGISGEEDITQGLPRVKQILDNVKPSSEEKAILATSTGIITEIEPGTIKQKDTQSQKEIVYRFEEKKISDIRQGDLVKKGEVLVHGKVDLTEYLKIMGWEACQIYIKEEVKKVYESQGIDINEKHFEIFARQMLSKVEITKNGDSDYLIGDLVNYQQAQEVKQSLIAKNQQPTDFKYIVLGLKDLASRPSSFLAGISFQNTLKSLINYSLYQPVDYLTGSKENLIAGQLIPVGTGFKEREKLFYKPTKKSDPFHNGEIK